jgi:DNA-binding HxlR family transcriptional regulator
MEWKDRCTTTLCRGVGLIQEKWTLQIISHLLDEPVGFNELARKTQGVSATTLSQRLNFLEDAGLVKKTIHSTMPPRTSYELTEAGDGLLPVLQAIQDWSAKHLADDSKCDKVRAHLESNEEAS